ncbi:GNAT family N-acetyltransferase [Ectobacillus ponti]|uniref:GNAT family N-acetyltransferase n=1 Tax=Ectobacillus ponti TaxID=2961894 RepID=A0AA41X6H0_9BACI|nr:GNAT family N-acetyltransferase [Ectobacillus ponti]
MDSILYETDRLRLRPLSYGDAELIEMYAGDYEVAKTTLNIPYPYPKGSALDFIKATVESDKKGNSFSLAITLQNDPAIIGLMGLSISQKHKRAELSYWIGKPYWGMGYGTEAAKMVMKIGFEQLDLHKIFAAAFTDNPASWRIMEKVGMREEGVFRQHVLKWDTFKDLSFYSILKSEYGEIHQ